MNVVRMKRGVVLIGNSPCLFRMIDAAKYAFFSIGKDVVITSGCEGTHKVVSLHYKGRALDFRSRHLTTDEKIEVAGKMRVKLGDDYDVLHEGGTSKRQHFHVEYDPDV
jgi:hypothetical protein